MIRRTCLAALALVASSTLALAGPGGKCAASTQECLDHLSKDTAGRGWVGIKMEETESGRLMVREVVKGSPAEKAGLLEGDVLVSVNGKAYGSMSDEDMKAVQAAMKPGSVLTYVVDRAGSEKTVKVELGRLPDDVRYQMIGHHMATHHCADGAAKVAGIEELSVEEVAKLAAAGKVAIFDANGREVREKFGVIPKATLLTSSSEYDAAKTLPKDKDAKLVFYCANPRCTASDAAAKRAREAGYENVAVLRAGIMGWKDAGQKTAPVPQS